MTFEDFKDWLFEVLNDLDNDILVDIKTNDKADTFELIMVGGDVFEIECRETKSQGGIWKKKTEN